MSKKRKPAKRIFRKEEIENYDYHLPVLLKESVDYLVTDNNGIYADGTLGGGGHSAEILARLGDKALLLAFDKDPAAISHCREKFRGELELGDQSRLILINECYSTAFSIERFRGKINGLLLDLGVSSRQLDDSRRGFSYRVNTSLDLRFGSTGKSAEDILHAETEENIERIIRLYGEEPFSRIIARRIVERRRAISFKSTFDLRALVEEVVPRHLHTKALSRVFQALRIAVNEELEVLGKALESALGNLASGGRIVVISYHSLEDRIVKVFFKEHTKKHVSEYDNNKAINVPTLNIITPKPIYPDEKEITRNPRARSAKLRVAEVIR